VIFLVIDDENLTQILANILQVKERGATVIVITNLTNIESEISISKIDFLVQIFPQRSLFAPLLCTTPLLMTVYFTALAKGINPDSSMIAAINYQS
jgi:glucosamine 6-phosphate synthetase-like amidotransferase/phosphosugar isomerase protein